MKLISNLKVNFQKKGSDTLEEVTLLELFNLCTTIHDYVSDDIDLPQNVIDVLLTFGDDETGNNDIEQTLVEIKNSLQYDEEYTALEEISSRLEVIDTRLDLEFEVLNFGISVIGTVALAYASGKFLSWLVHIFSNR